MSDCALRAGSSRCSIIRALNQSLIGLGVDFRFKFPFRQCAFLDAENWQNRGVGIIRQPLH